MHNLLLNVVAVTSNHPQAAQLYIDEKLDTTVLDDICRMEVRGFSPADCDRIAQRILCFAGMCANAKVLQMALPSAPTPGVPTFSARLMEFVRLPHPHLLAATLTATRTLLTHAYTHATVPQARPEDMARFTAFFDLVLRELLESGFLFDCVNDEPTAASAPHTSMRPCGRGYREQLDAREAVAPQRLRNLQEAALIECVLAVVAMLRFVALRSSGVEPAAMASLCARGGRLLAGHMHGLLPLLEVPNDDVRLGLVSLIADDPKCVTTEEDLDTLRRWQSSHPPLPCPIPALLVCSVTTEEDLDTLRRCLELDNKLAALTEGHNEDVIATILELLTTYLTQSMDQSEAFPARERRVPEFSILTC
ncbi:hypothetical protein PAPYR_9208 [Paratrimastix pyriformis]|uniref:Uncharacterized protein n=1 Tax=Paratrimastix pyriformis TaxID=342808 RepID=A0ABQ8UBI7_9EUKA|nr:hypothetical protein PAPYR_9208 [Paratrimastix pyriformis]